MKPNHPKELIEITRDQFAASVVSLNEGNYILENETDTVEFFVQHTSNLRFFLANNSYGQTSRLVIIDPEYTDSDNELLFCCCNWWILSEGSWISDFPTLPEDMSHLSKGSWCGVKWFTVDYVTGYDGEDFVEEFAKDMELLREVLILCGAEDWEDSKLVSAPTKVNALPSAAFDIKHGIPLCTINNPAVLRNLVKYLFGLLDNIDTAVDEFKPPTKVTKTPYFQSVNKYHNQRWEKLSSDGYDIFVNGSLIVECSGLRWAVAALTERAKVYFNDNSEEMTCSGVVSREDLLTTLNINAITEGINKALVDALRSWGVIGHIDDKEVLTMTITRNALTNQLQAKTKKK